ncbi:hypothetical protein [Mesorhizobium sp. M0816]|uniref:hypothetical protein n=1 Tax=Mesorhizobium sp. M0816 TaxID=2957006 RepID=UPI003337206B
MTSRTGPRFEWLAWVVYSAMGIAAIVFIAIAITSFIAGGGSSDKCWNNGGRSDDTYNC